tara:strand:+ start:1558 stop:1878 length:321 start_codon:yes stop_codon:yes gene_type:complete
MNDFLSLSARRPFDYVAVAVAQVFGPGFVWPSSLNWSHPGAWAVVALSVALFAAHAREALGLLRDARGDLGRRFVALRAAWARSPWATEAEREAARARGELAPALA